MFSRVPARSLWSSVADGFSAASFCWIAWACSYAASAWAGLPVRESRIPMLLVALRPRRGSGPGS